MVVSSSDDEDGHSETESESRRTATRWKKSSTFTKTLLSETLPVKIEEKFPELLTKSCYEIWNLYFTDELFSYILEQTKLYAGRDKNDPSFDISLNNLRNYIGILIFLDIVSSERDHWSNQPDLKVPFISETMSRDKFLSIKK